MMNVFLSLLFSDHSPATGLNCRLNDFCNHDLQNWQNRILLAMLLSWRLLIIALFLPGQIFHSSLWKKTHFSARTNLTGWKPSRHVSMLHGHNFFVLFCLCSTCWLSLYLCCWTAAATTIHNLSQWCSKQFVNDDTIYQTQSQLVFFWLWWCRHRANF